jgi:hypothetical protein
MYLHNEEKIGVCVVVRQYHGSIGVVVVRASGGLLNG